MFYSTEKVTVLLEYDKLCTLIIVELSMYMYIQYVLNTLELLVGSAMQLWL